MVLTSLAFAVGQLWIGIQNAFRRRNGKLPIQKVATVETIPVGSSATFNYPGEHDACLLIRPEPGVFLAYSQSCTHLSCAVVPKVGSSAFTAPATRVSSTCTAAA